MPKKDNNSTPVRPLGQANRKKPDSPLAAANELAMRRRERKVLDELEEMVGNLDASTTQQTITDAKEQLEGLLEGLEVQAAQEEKEEEKKQEDEELMKETLEEIEGELSKQVPYRARQAALKALEAIPLDPNNTDNLDKFFDELTDELHSWDNQSSAERGREHGPEEMKEPTDQLKQVPSKTEAEPLQEQGLKSGTISRKIDTNAANTNPDNTSENLTTIEPQRRGRRGAVVLHDKEGKAAATQGVGKGKGRPTAINLGKAEATSGAAAEPQRRGRRGAVLHDKEGKAAAATQVVGKGKGRPTAINLGKAEATSGAVAEPQRRERRGAVLHDKEGKAAAAAKRVGSGKVRPTAINLGKDEATSGAAKKPRRGTKPT
jgi:hypothetical protein